MQVLRNYLKPIPIILAILFSIGMSILWYKIAIDPSIVFLTPENNAQWIMHDRPIELVAKLNARKNTAFKKTISTPSHISSATISLKALRYYSVYFDDQLILQSPPSKISTKNDWKKAKHVTIKNIAPGNHELIIVIMNYNGPPTLLAYCDELNFRSDTTWLSTQSANENQWQPVMLASKRQTVSYTKSFMPSYIALFNNIHYIILVFVVLAMVLFLQSKKIANDFFARWFPDPIIHFRWLLIVLWIILSITSLINHPIGGGDYQHHLAYIEYIAKKQALPLATDGMEMFQSPLYYLVSAMLLKTSLLFFELETSLRLLKLIPLLCGLAMIEICYRTVLCVFPNQPYKQFVGLLVGALMPMNLHMSQYIANEPMAAVFSALSVFVVLKFLINPDLALQQRQHYILGILLGLGLLSKVTVLLLILLSTAALIWVLFSLNQNYKFIAISCLRVIGIIFVIAGWYYVRNWIFLGKPFIGGWDPANGLYWWQEPGYRVIEHFTTFGLSLFYPIYAGTVGFWDSVYSNFWTDAGLGGFISKDGSSYWNLSFMLALPLLSLAPTIAILSGSLSIFKPRELKNNSILIFATACVTIYFAALMYMYILVPMHSQGRATYTMGIIPCYAILCAQGVSMFSKGAVTQGIFTGLLLVWGIFSFISFFPA